jgi:hypothetical protein
MNEPSDEKKALIVARAEKKRKIVERQKKNLERKARLAKPASGGKEVSKYDDKPKLSEQEIQKLGRHFLKQTEHEAGKTRPEYQGMAIGFLMGSTKNPDLRGMIAGLSGLKNEKEK